MIIGREMSIGIDAGARADRVSDAMRRERERLAELEERWKEETRLVLEILNLRRRLCEATAQNGVAGFHDHTTRVQCSKNCAPCSRALHGRQGEAPLILPSVDEQAVAAVVGDWTGIPVQRMVRNEAELVLTLADTLACRVVGQDHALRMISSPDADRSRRTR